MVLRFFTWTNTQITHVRNSLTAPHLLVHIADSGPIPPYITTRSQSEAREDEPNDPVAPSAALLIHPHGSYHALPSSDIN
jgi:hypothetical protein